MNRRHFLGSVTAATVGLTGCLGDPEYRITDIDIPEQRGPIAVEVILKDSHVTVDSPARLAVTLRNQGTTAVQIRNVGVWPLGLLALSPLEDDDYQILLYSDRYAGSDSVDVSPNGVGVDNDPIVQSLSAGESVMVQYKVDGKDRFVSERYVLRGYFDEALLSYRESDSDDWSLFRPNILITLEEKSIV